MNFTADELKHGGDQIFGVPVQIWWFWYQNSRRYLHCLCEIISDILSHWLPTVEWRSVSATRLKILVGQMSPKNHSSTDFFYLSPSSAHCKGSQFLEFVRPQGWLLFLIVIPFFSVSSVMVDSLLYSSWGIVYITVISLCIVWVFICRWLYYFQWN